MAVVECLPVREASHLHNLIDYVQRDNKTAEKELVYCFGCQLETAYNDFSTVKKLTGKRGGILAHQIIQSFAIGETTAEQAHEISCKLAEENLQGYQYTVCTHVDRNHIHSHIVINSVNQETGQKYHSNLKSLSFLRRESDRLCKEYGLSVIENTSGLQRLDKTTYEIAKNGKSWKVKLSNDIDEALLKSKNRTDFDVFLASKGYNVKWTNKNITIQINDKYRVRLDTLAKQFGTKYCKANIEKSLGIETELEAPEQFTRQVEVSDEDSVILKAEKFLKVDEKTIEQIEENLLFEEKEKEFVYMKLGNISKYKLLNSFGETSSLNINATDIPKLEKLGIYYAGSASQRGVVIHFKAIHNELVAAALGIKIEDIKNVNEKRETKRANELMKAISKTENRKLYRIKLTAEQVDILKNNEIPYAFYRNGKEYNTVIFRDELKKVCTLTNIDYISEIEKIAKRANLTVYSELKKTAVINNEKVSYRMIDRSGLEKLEMSEIKFAYFEKDGKYNVAMLESSIKRYEEVIAERNSEKQEKGKKHHL